MAAPPIIFAPARKRAARRRMLAMQRVADAPRYVIADMIDDVSERLDFLRHVPSRSLIIGDWTGELVNRLGAFEPDENFDEERPFPTDGFDLVVNLGLLDTVNDLPGALIHMRNALAPGGLMIAEMLGAGSLPALRAAMFEADGDRPAPRMHPMVDVRAGGTLLQRTGFADPVIDSRSLDVRFSSFERLIADVRAQGLGNVLADPGPAPGKESRNRARDAFAAPRVERFEILTLSGWKR